MASDRKSGSEAQLDLLSARLEAAPPRQPATAAAAPETTPSARVVDEGSRITSSSHPLVVHWLSELRAPWARELGSVGLAHAPGIREIAASQIPWERDLDADVEALRAAGATLIVDTASDEERARLGMSELPETAKRHGIELLRLECTAESAPSAPGTEVLARIEETVRGGGRAVIISREGVGRAGMIAAALARRVGASTEDALDALRTMRGRRVASSDAQQAWVASIEAPASHTESDTPSPDEEDDLSAREAPDDLHEESTPDDDEPTEWRAETGATDALSSERDAEPVASIDASVRRSLRPRAAANAGAVLGGAIGDAMGHPTEFLSMDGIRAKWGASGVQRFELYWDRGGKRFAPYTDDTQMAEVVLRTLLWSRRQSADLDRTMEELARGFVAWAEHPQGGHRAPGNACMSGARALARGEHWSRAGGASAGGCGSVMRAYPFGLLFAHDLERCEEWSVAHSKLTHRDPIALAASAAMAVGVARVLRGDATRVVLSEMIAAAARHSARTAAMMAEALDEADRGVGPEVTLDRLRGWAAHEAIAAAVYIVAKHPDDPEAAILAGANTPGDSDSLATLAGSLVGARSGLDAMPDAWVRDIERSDELLALALEI